MIRLVPIAFGKMTRLIGAVLICLSLVEPASAEAWLNCTLNLKWLNPQGPPVSITPFQKIIVFDENKPHRLQMYDGGQMTGWNDPEHVGIRQNEIVMFDQGGFLMLRVNRLSGQIDMQPLCRPGNYCPEYRGHCDPMSPPRQKF